MKPIKWIIWILVGIVVLGGASLAIYNHSVTTSKTSKTKQIQSAAIVKVNYSSKYGNYLTDLTGRTLYEYNKDTNGLSSCLGACIVVWPPYQTTTQPKLLPAGFGYIKRSDTGYFQYTYNGKPLYYYESDTVGNIKGNQIGGFSIIKG